MNRTELTRKEKQLALSSLLRRDRNDPGAAELLVKLMFDREYRIRKRAVSLSDRFVRHDQTLKALLRVASEPDERTLLRKRALQKLEIPFDPDRSLPPEYQTNPDVTYQLKRKILQIVRSVDDPLKLRGQALELSAYFVSEELLKEWIFYFHNKRDRTSRLAAISAMGRSGDRRWRKYIRKYIASDCMEFTCAALEAIADQEYTPEDMLEDTEVSAEPEPLRDEPTFGG